MKINWNEASTKRGVIVLFLALVGTIGWFMGKDVTGLITLTMAISGYMKVSIPDNLK